MPPREPARKTYVWRSFNLVYGPWYRLVLANGKAPSGAECVVQPDMDRGRWFWYVRIGKKDNPRERHSGHEATLEAAKQVARITFDERY